MRTTINLPDGLAEAAKRRAAAEGRTFTSLIEEGLRTVIDRSTSHDPTIALPSFGRRAGVILVDLHDREATWAALEDDAAGT